jgi:FKBP-type peptidyl-prolyl cis-trans isomerase
MAVACGGSSQNPAAPSGTASAPFSIVDLSVGAGAAAAAGQRVTVDYAGWFYSATAAENKGTLFDTSLNSQPFSFVLGTGAVIAGWDQGVAGMRVGGTRRLVIPPALAYGAAGRPPVIPPNATLVFDIALLSIP